jgi:UDP-N-acetylglucosamine/UDP-N-acetylgalactosamine diphosphorylase
LALHGQEHVLQFWEQLDSHQRGHLQRQIESLDLELLDSLVAGHDQEIDFAKLASQAQAPPAVREDGSGASWTLQQARQRGEEALSRGEVGAVIVAGGQGTRLGFDHPKGMFPIGPVSGRTLFRIFADRLIATRRRYGTRIPLYLMTSDATDQETRNYFESNQFLGLDRSDVVIFQQGTMPAVDAETGRLLLETADSLALSPDGHGGTVTALARHHCLADAAERGVRHLSYIQVDNPLAALCDPTLLGHHLLAESEMTTQVVRKHDPLERVGNVVWADGRVQIIEYSDLPAAVARTRSADGQLQLWAGNIAVHVIEVEFLRRMSASAQSLPFHLARKKVPFLSPEGELIQPETPNAVKFERFIFDLLPEARNAMVVEARPQEAFAPVKNADSADSDTPRTAKAAISQLHRSWLELAGAVVAGGVQVEISPRFALDRQELAARIPAKLIIDADRYFDG